MSPADASISGTTLPAFDRFRAGEVEPTIRALLERNRGEVATLEAQPHPTFENTVLPLEQLSHRLSRTWSPVSHLNGVLNSDELRASYNACLPLLSNYRTDLAQSEPLYPRVQRHRRQRSRRARRRATPRDRARAEDFRLAGVGLPTERKQRFKAVMQELAQLGAKFEENVLDAMNAWTHHVTDAAELAGINPVIVEQARERAARKGRGRLAARARAAHLRRRDAPTRTPSRCGATSTKPGPRAPRIAGPRAGKFDNTR